MAARRQILTLVLVSSISISLACGSGGSSTTTGKQVQPVSIALNPAPAATTIAVANTTGIQFTPVVSNDPNNYGVDWALTCTVSNCGTLSSANSNFHTGSGTAVTYLPPTVLFTGSVVVNVTAFATADHTKNVTTPITVTTYTGALNGTYILQVAGVDNSGNPYQSTGVFVFDGNGNVTSGQQTLNASSTNSSGALIMLSSPYTVGAASTYFVGPDGRGNVTLNLEPTGTNTSNSPITENLTFTVISSSLARVADFTGSSPGSPGSSGSGTLELQDVTAAATMPMGAYAFATIGTDSGNTNGPQAGTLVPTVIGGIFNIDNPGSISGNGSLADQDYYNSSFARRLLLSCAAPTSTNPTPGLTGSISQLQPPSLGVVIITLQNPGGSPGNTCFGQTSPSAPASVIFTGYIVNANEIRLIESDDFDGTSGFVTAGIAVQQNATPGTFTSTSLSGPNSASYVFGVLGYDIPYSSGFSLTSAAVLNFDVNGGVSGITDTFFPALSLSSYTDYPLTGTYSVDATGRAELLPKFTSLNGIPAPHPKILLYLTGNCTPPPDMTGNCPPPLVLWSDGADPNEPTIGTGIAYPQATSTLSLGAGTYGFTFTENNGGETDGNGEVQAAISGSQGTLTGNVEDSALNDFNPSSTAYFQPIIDDFGSASAASPGRIPGTFEATDTTPRTFEYYLVDGNCGFMIETDLTASNQVGLGQFAQSCDVTNATSCQAAVATSCQPAAQDSASAKRSLKRGGSRSVKQASDVAGVSKESATPGH